MSFIRNGAFGYTAAEKFQMTAWHASSSVTEAIDTVESTNHGPREIMDESSYLDLSSIKVAIVHDYLAQAGGAERVVEAIHRLFPQAPIFTSVFDPKATLPYFEDKDVRTSFLQRTPFSSQRWHKFALSLYPIAFEEFDLSDYDLVISSSSGFAKGVMTGPHCCHICYCHTPPRYAWRHHEYMSQSKLTSILSPFLSGTLSTLRLWDVASSNRVDYFVANSRNIAHRIRKYYRRDSEVIFPPVQTNRFCPANMEDVGDYFLVVSRLVGYKRIDLAVEACTRLGVPLRVVGGGPDLESLKKKAGPNVSFLGRLADKQIASELAHCRAMIFPGEEDFGITPLECMASGRPVVAFGAGGALETIIDGKTGVFFEEQTVESVINALRKVCLIDVDPTLISEHAKRFDTSTFEARFKQFTLAALDDHRSQYLRRKPSMIAEFK